MKTSHPDATRTSSLWEGWRRRLLSLTAFAFVAIGPGAQAAETPIGVHRAGEIVTEAATVKAADGRMVRFELGTLFVPENRTAKDSRIIAIGFARLRPDQPTGAPPMFALPGGPGDSFLGAFSETGERPRRQLAQLLQYSRAGDVVVIDQRGYSRRGEMLSYAPHPIARPLDQPASLVRETASDLVAFKAAVAANADKDLSGYTVLQCADDVDDLRRALGYERITLLGQSFGSQWSFAVMRRHPGVVARALLSGVEPIDYGYDMPSHVHAALQRIAWDADHDAGLKPYLPAGGVMAAARAVRQRLAVRPVRVEVKDSGTGRRGTVVLGAEDFQQALLSPVAGWPALILSAYYGHYDDWAGEVIKQRAASDEREALIGPLIDTSLGVTPAREHLLRTDPAVEIMGAWDFNAYIASVGIWPSPDIGDELRQPVLDRTPVLFVSGDWDTSTPMENMLNMLPYFPNSRAVLVHRGGHNARSVLLEQQPKVADAVVEFLRTGDTTGLPVNASLPAPAFRKPDFSPPAGRKPH